MTAMPLVKLEVAPTSDPLSVSPAWVDISEYMTATAGGDIGSVQRAKGRAGLLHVVLDNSTAVFNGWNVASPLYGNLLTANQASLETDTTGWAAVTNCALARSTARALDGAASLRMTAAAGGDMNAATETARSTIVAGKPFTAIAYVSPATTARNARVVLRWFDVGNNFLSQDLGSSTAEAASPDFTLLTVTATAPTNATRADVLVQVLSAGAGEQHYVDQIGIFGGSSAAWSAGGREGNIQPMVKVRLSAQWNRLTANQASLETDTTGHVAETNCSIARVTSRSAVGAASLRMTATAGGDMNGTTSPTGSTVTGGQTYTGVVWFSAQSTLRNVRTVLRWYDAGNSFISQSVGSTVGEAAGVGFTQTFVTATAPVTATRANLLYQVLSAGAGEQHYVDALGIMEGSDPAWDDGGPDYLFTGFVEDWAAEWESIKFGDTVVRAVGVEKAITLVKPSKTDYYDAVIADTPAGYFRLNETGVSSAVNGLITAEDESGNNRDGTHKGSIADFEVDGALPAEPGTAVDYGVRTGWTELPSTVCPSGTTAFAVELWVEPRAFSDPAVGATSDRLWHVAAVGTQIVQIALYDTGKINFAVRQGDGPGTGGVLASTVALDKNRKTHVVCVKTGSAGPTNWRIYINGVDRSDHATETTYNGGNVSLTTNWSLIAGNETSGVSRGAFDGIIDEFAIYHSALSSGRVTAHYDAGYGLVEAVLTGSRIGKLLDLIGIPAGDRTIDAGQFLMQPLRGSIYDSPIFGLIERYVESEGWPACWFTAGDGKFVFQDRAHSTPSSSATFADSSSTLYYDAGPGPSRSDKSLWTEVTLQADQGKPQNAKDATAAVRYIGRTLTRTGLLNNSDADVATVTSAELARWKTPKDRIDRLVLHPVDEPSTLWPQVLGRELNDRITVNRTDLPGGGTAFTGDFRIEEAEHRFAAQDWYCTWVLEPT